MTIGDAMIGDTVATTGAAPIAIHVVGAELGAGRSR